MVQNRVVFHSLAEAIRAGFEVCNPIENGYFVRSRTGAGWIFAIVALHSNADGPDPLSPSAA
jgi:hypothetical protein